MDQENFGDFLVRHYRAFLAGSGVIIIICVIVLAGLGISQIRVPKTFLSISVVPGNADIQINGQSYHNGIYEFKPGFYTASITSEGFSSENSNITVSEGETAQLSVVLENQKDGMEYYIYNKGDLNILGSMDNEKARSFMEEYNKQISIKNYFPIDASYGTDWGFNYSQTISDGSSETECKRAFCLLVKGYGEPNNEVIEEKLSDLGYNLNDYQVIYDFRS